jgi:hypothetical protein
MAMALPQDPLDPLQKAQAEDAADTSPLGSVNSRMARITSRASGVSSQANERSISAMLTAWLASTPMRLAFEITFLAAAAVSASQAGSVSWSTLGLSDFTPLA